jgi:nucleoid-associated protein YgaU
LEYKEIQVPKLNSSNENKEQNASRPSDKDTSSNQNKPQQKTYKVVKGDSLWAIAQKHYGKGSLYTKIQNANKSKYPSLKKNANYIQVGWELIIP